MMKTNGEIRAAARARLGGGIFGNYWLTALVAVVIYAALSSVLSCFAIGVVFFGVLSVGYAAFFLTLSRRNVADVANMLYSVKSGERFTHSILVGLFTMVFTFLWSLLFLIPGIVKSYAYALAPYLAVEREDLDARECIAESARLMEGHKWQLFMLDLSFIGWYLLGLLCCCIGIYFVEPYRQAARTEFYCSLTDAPIDTTVEDVATEA